MQQHIGRARRLQRSEGADGRLVTERADDRFVLEPLLEEVVAAHGEQISQAEELSADLPVPPGEGSQVLHALEIAPRRIDRRLEHHVAHHRGGVGHVGVEIGVGLGVLLRQACEGALGDGGVVVHDDRTAIVGRMEDALAGQNLEAVVEEVQIVDDALGHHPEQVGRQRHAEAGHDLFCRRRAADDVTAFEHQRLEPRAGQDRTAGQAIMARADDDRVVALRHPRLRPFVAYFAVI